MSSKEFRAELVKIMPGYSWTVHQDRTGKWLREKFPATPVVLTATGIKSSGSNRLSTLEVSRRDDCGHVTYTAKSSGYGTRAPWLHEHKAGTLARALRGLQDHYAAMASTYATHSAALKNARAAQEGGNAAKGA
ncbi:hypothetical protein ACFIQG_21005 [Comamonas odontotermitis]|uniref:hypothetical protein n=1 Tax=Comamonas odontotermitis TaxID=379895 RepID=UPI003670CD25